MFDGSASTEVWVKFQTNFCDCNTGVIVKFWNDIINGFLVEWNVLKYTKKCSIRFDWFLKKCINKFHGESAFLTDSDYPLRHLSSSVMIRRHALPFAESALRRDRVPKKCDSVKVVWKLNNDILVDVVGTAAGWERNQSTICIIICSYICQNGMIANSASFVQ